MSDDDDVPQLSAHALAALKEFYSEETEKQQKSQEDAMKVGGVEEDWHLSQFWYDDLSAEKLAKEALDASGPNGRIACVSCPTLYQKLQEMKPSTCTTILLEYDKRFGVYGDDFVFYDYNEPLRLPESLKEQSFDIVIGDPPYLKETCLEATSKTLKFLSKEKILLCTGAVMEPVADRVLGVKPCQFRPKHTNNLANEFRCYSNYPTKFLNGEG